MGDPSKRRLVVPKLLAAFALGAAPSCSEGPSRPHGSVSGETECYDILDEATCEAETAFSCRWEGISCEPFCEPYTEQDECEADDSCEWIGDACMLGIS